MRARQSLSSNDTQKSLKWSQFGKAVINPPSMRLDIIDVNQDNNTDDKDCDQDSKYDSNEFLEDLEIEDNDYNYPSDNNDNARTEEHNFHY
jgi:hypothetical protein